MASLIRFAAQSPDRLGTVIPMFKWWKSKWIPSGMLESHIQLRQLPNIAPILPTDMKVDHQRWKRGRKEGVVPKQALTGPCVFGCATSLKATATAKSTQRWYRVPVPSPWPGIASGETLCMRCYAWGVSNPRARKRKQQAAGLGIASKVCKSSFYRIIGLSNRTDLNGLVCRAEMLPDDAGRVMVSCNSQLYRLRQDNLQPASDAEICHRLVA